MRVLCSFPRSSPKGVPKSPLPGGTRHRGAWAVGREGAGARNSEEGAAAAPAGLATGQGTHLGVLRGSLLPVTQSWPFLPPTVQVQSKATRGPGARAGKGFVLVANGPRKGSFPYALRAPELLVTTPVQPRAQRWYWAPFPSWRMQCRDQLSRQVSPVPFPQRKGLCWHQVFDCAGQARKARG